MYTFSRTRRAVVTCSPGQRRIATRSSTRVRPYLRRRTPHRRLRVPQQRRSIRALFVFPSRVIAFFRTCRETDPAGNVAEGPRLIPGRNSTDCPTLRCVAITTAYKNWPRDLFCKLNRYESWTTIPPVRVCQRVSIHVGCHISQHIPFPFPLLCSVQIVSFSFNKKKNNNNKSVSLFCTTIEFKFLNTVCIPLEFVVLRILVRNARYFPCRETDQTSRLGAAVDVDKSALRSRR